MQRCPQENIGAGGGRGEEGGGASHVAKAPAMEPKEGRADVTMEVEAPQVDHIANLDAYIIKEIMGEPKTTGITSFKPLLV